MRLQLPGQQLDLQKKFAAIAKNIVMRNPLTFAEFLFRTLFIAGQETTLSFIANSLWLLLANPGCEVWNEICRQDNVLSS